MALDYSMMRSALDTATAAKLARAQSIGASASDLGFTGAHQWNEIGGKQGLMSFLRGRSNPFTQESIEGSNRVYGQPNPEFGNYGNTLPKDVPMNQRVSFEDPNRVYGKPFLRGVPSR